MTLPHTGGTEWAAAQATPWTTVNQTLRRLDGFCVRTTIEDDDLNDAPGACADGARYLVGASPTGGDPWETHDGELAIAVGVNAANGWLFINVAVEGSELHVRDENLTRFFNGAAWITPATIADAAGGGTVDTEARAAINAVLAHLRAVHRIP